MNTYLKLLFLILSINFIYAQDSSQTLIPLVGTGVEEFLLNYPEYDGRGTVVIVLDTGIDMGIAGLTKTSTGETKVIDVQDFTGQGDIIYYKAKIDEDGGVHYLINKDNNLKVKVTDNSLLNNGNDEFFIGVLHENLWKNSGSGIKDINGNGKQDDLFYFAVFKSDNSWIILLDKNNDGDISDEKPIRNYKENFDTFSFENKNGLPLLTIAVNIFPEENKVSFFFDDGGHGTHCAGIAAGSRIGDTFVNGVAPGAKLIGLKIGNNNFSGGATVTESMKKAYLYADKLSKEIKEPCIINMSYGIGSEIEGHSEMEYFLDELVKNNPYLYIAKSNDNEGPGISSIGLPSNKSSVFSSGAVLTKDAANNLYGAALDRDILLHFSSRGAETSKPDVIAPGACVSTVPNFDNNDRYWGTSMASPYSAGVMALLLSAAKSEFPDVKIPSAFLYKTIREGAVKWNDYDHVDQGGGFINIMNAYKYLLSILQTGELNNFETYSITSYASSMPDKPSPNLYIRNASYLTGAEDFTFRIKRNNFINKPTFYRLYNIKSDSDWLKPVQSKIHLRNDQTAALNVKLDKSKMTEPGMYNGKIYAYRDGSKNILEFEMMATVIVPFQFNQGNDYSQSFMNETLMPGVHKRYFLNVPPGASNMRISLNSARGQFTSLRYYLHDPAGRGRKIGYVVSDAGGASYEDYFYNPEPGVYELIVIGNFTAGRKSTYDLQIEFDGIRLAEGDHICQNNKTMSLINLFDKPADLLLSAQINSYERNYSINLDKTNYLEIPFVLTKEETGRRFDLKLNYEDFNKLTDFAVLIFDEDNNTLSSGGFSYHYASISVKNNFKQDEKKLKLVLVPGYAHDKQSMKVNVVETTTIKDSKQIKLSSERVKLYPASPRKITLDYSLPEISIPIDAKFKAVVNFKSSSKEKVEYELPIYFTSKGGTK